MYQKQPFDKFYSVYMGLENGRDYKGIQVCKSKTRDLPLNKHFYYKAIVTNYKGKPVISCSEDFTEMELEKICGRIDFQKISREEPQEKIVVRNYKASYMLRMLLKSAVQPEEIEGFIVNEKPVEFRYMESNRKFLAIQDGELLGYSKVSDVISGYGNIVVWVDPAYRRKGIAEQLVRRTLQQCAQDQLMPMYIVRTENHASVALAEKLGVEIVQKEWILSYDDSE